MISIPPQKRCFSGAPGGMMRRMYKLDPPKGLKRQINRIGRINKLDSLRTNLKIFNDCNR